VFVSARVCVSVSVLTISFGHLPRTVPHTLPRIFPRQLHPQTFPRTISVEILPEKFSGQFVPDVHSLSTILPSCQLSITAHGLHVMFLCFLLRAAISARMRLAVVFSVLIWITFSFFCYFQQNK